MMIIAIKRDGVMLEVGGGGGGAGHSRILLIP